MNHSVAELEPYDPRSVANAILMMYAIQGKKVTNLALQKLLYFCHAHYLASTGRPLVQGYFEAWTHGPVHPTVYAAFKEKKGEPLCALANSKDIRTGTFTTVPPPTRADVCAAIEQVVTSLSQLTAGQLVALSHARDGPWHVVYERSRSRRMLGLRISNDLIRERGKFHKMSAERLTGVREPNEDTPLANHGFG